MTPEQLAQALVAGTVDDTEVPELHSGPLRDEVVQRLSSVGMELVHSKSKHVFFAHPASHLTGEDLDGFKPHHHLRDDARWVLSVLWMFLVYLPDLSAERNGQTVRQPSIRSQDLSAFVRETGMKATTFQLILGQLKRAGFVEGTQQLREGYRMSALATWEMTANWDRCVQEFRRKEWFRQKYESYLAQRGQGGNVNSDIKSPLSEDSDATD